MRRHLTRLSILLVAALMLASVAPSATASAQRAPLSDEGCEAFNDYFQVSFAVALITGFAEAFEDLDDDSGDTDDDGTTDTDLDSSDIFPDDRDDSDDPDDPDDDPSDDDDPSSADIEQVQNVMFLVLSPKMEQATSVLTKEAPRSVRTLFREQRDVYRDGVEILRDDLGLSDEQIEAIRDTDFNVDTPDTIEDDLDVSKEELDAAAEDFGKSAEVLRAEDATEAQSRAFNRLAVGCGAVPDDDLDCDELVSADLQEQLLEGPADVDDDGGCTYTGPEDSEGDEPEIGVDVYRTAEAFDRLTTQNDSATELDDDNVVADGFVTFNSFKTCGRTLFSLADQSTTIVVAICLPEDAEVPDDMLTDVRDSVESVIG